MAKLISLLGCFAVLLSASSAHATRIKDLVTVKGVRSNMLEGIGLVVGLAGSGDSPRSVARQAVLSYLRKRGLNVPVNDLRMRNVAFVTVVAELPPYAAKGARLDVKVMASGDARSLRGGTLLLTPLIGLDGAAYAVAQGSVTVGGFNASAGRLAAIQRNTPTSGRIPSGALVEREVKTRFINDDTIVLSLNDADFTTAFRIMKAVNESLKSDVASTDNPGSVSLKVPTNYQQNPVEFLSIVEGIDVQADSRARVVLNERTGTVVVGGEVTIRAASVAHGNLNVAVSTQLTATQPGPFARQGQTAIVPNGNVAVDEEKGSLRALPATTSVDDLVKALNALGASPQDLVSILQALHQAGALSGELVVQ